MYAKKAPAKEIGQTLGYIVEHMATKEDLAVVKREIADLKTEMVDQFDRVDKQFRANNDRLRDISSEIAVIRRRIVTFYTYNFRGGLNLLTKAPPRSLLLRRGHPGGARHRRGLHQANLAHVAANHSAIDVRRRPDRG